MILLVLSILKAPYLIGILIDIAVFSPGFHSLTYLTINSKCLHSLKKSLKWAFMSCRDYKPLSRNIKIRQWEDV